MHAEEQGALLFAHSDDGKSPLLIFFDQRAIDLEQRLRLVEIDEVDAELLRESARNIDFLAQTHFDERLADAFTARLCVVKRRGEFPRVNDAEANQNLTDLLLTSSCQVHISS